MALLRSAAAYLKRLPEGTVIEVAGYTDNTGNEDGNKQLSERRAAAVGKALVESGAEAASVVAKGYGSADPVADNDTTEGRFRNRRIEYRLTKP